MKKLLSLVLPTLIAGTMIAVSCDDGNGTPIPGGEETLAAPSSLDATDITDSGATLSWQAVQGASNYEVSITAEDAPEITKTISERYAVITVLDPQTTYSWRVRALNGELAGEWATGPSFTTLPVDAGIPVPTNLVVTKIARQEAYFAWDAVEEADYYLFRLLQQGSVIYEERTPDDEPIFAILGLTPGTRYSWTVRTAVGARVSAWATPSEFKTSSREDILGLYEANGTPSVLGPVLGQTPGPASWMGVIFDPGQEDWYTVTNPFGRESNEIFMWISCDPVTYALELDAYEPIAEGYVHNSVPMDLFVGAFIFDDDNELQLLSPNYHPLEWDPVERTLSFPSQLNVGSLGTRRVMYGLVGRNQQGTTILSEFYSDLVFTVAENILNAPAPYGLKRRMSASDGMSYKLSGETVNVAAK
jgi:hypothetical protein